MIVTRTLQLKTKANSEVIDVTGKLQAELGETGLREGVATVFVAHSTVGVTTIECEPGLLNDFKAFFERVAPRGIAYEHDAGYGEGNGHAHVRASLLGPSLTIPFSGGRLLLGTWQQVVLVDFDNRPRTRQVIVQIAGE